MFFAHFFHYFYVPSTGPWYAGNVWGNVFVIPIAVVLGYVWAKTKFWPLRPLQHGLDHLHLKMDSLHRKHDAHAAKLDALTGRVEELHDKHDALAAQLTGDPPAAPS